MKKEIEKVMFVGIDDGKRKHDACFLESSGNTVKYMLFESRMDGFRKFIAMIEQFLREGYSQRSINRSMGLHPKNIITYYRNCSRYC